MAGSRTIERFDRGALLGVYGSALEPVIAAELRDVAEFSLLVCEGCDLRFFSPAVTGSARLYEALQAYEGYYQRQKPEFDFARSLIGPDQTVLEVGCGNGAFGVSIRPRSYTGLELTPVSAALARSRGLRVLEETVEQHAASHAGRYDTVCAFQVLEHVAAPRLFISDCLRALTPGGSLILSVPSADSFAGCTPNFALDLPPHHVTRWSAQCLSGLGRYFPMRFDRLWHESLQAVHRRMYASAGVTAFAYRLLGGNVPAVDRGRFCRVVVRLGAALAVPLSPLLALRSDVRGISVTALYRRLP